MREPLTKKQKSVYGWIIHFHTVNEYMPTRKEIAKKFGFASDNAAQCVLVSLAKKGYIKLIPKISRGIKITSEAA
jgi:repressor LexA